ncbi:SH3 domain-containing protein [Thalassotalea sp. Y01]|uniref:SH3 domain-containing protein n=1 Tax=Thalassotalea sp. Y01 TaxID=2729613 RepID=UPI00145E9F60|nr:SH3 domain-containing protein [Thalassotalea sp. Y01]NMP16531.1 SH3 domain-containing protein [Thalassotalea sp. Y01]
MQFLKSVFLVTLCLLSSSVFAEQQPVVQVNAPFIDMHSGPSTDFPVFYIAEQGEWITVVNRQRGYFKVITQDGTEGWVEEMTLNKTLDVNGKPVVVTASGLSGILEKFQ